MTGTGESLPPAREASLQDRTWGNHIWAWAWPYEPRSANRALPCA
jgi:hypothetical protein